MIYMFVCESCPLPAFPVFCVCVCVCVTYSCSYTEDGPLQGEDARNIPGESMTEEHYLDHDGNLISRKVTYASVNSTFLTNSPPTKSRLCVDQSHDSPPPFEPSASGR